MAKQCCAMLYNKRTKKSRQCKRKAVPGKSWCEKHGPMIDAYTDHANRAMKREANRS